MNSFKQFVKLRNAFNKSQNKKNVLGIWWYDIVNDNLEYFEDAKGHLDDMFTIRKNAKNNKTCRGRLLLINGETYLIIYRSPTQNINSNIISKIKNKVEKSSGKKVDYIIDDDGILITEKVTIIRR